MNDAYYLSLAIRAAENGLYSTHPNPRVGCVLVRDGQILSSGYHLQAGCGHAEANALKPLDGNAQGATAYVTMEPCSYAGRTPSCARALVSAGISRLVCAMTDPHPRNQGRGYQILREAGIEVVEGLLEAASRALNPGHISRFTLGRPYVRLKLAMSLDGKTALANGQSRWITGPEARADVQKLRARSSAIVTGVQTVIDDDPSLSVRADAVPIPHAALAARVSRKVVVLDPEARMPASAKLMADANLVLMTLADAKHIAPQNICHIKIAMAAGGPRKLDLSKVLQSMTDFDCNEVLFECGATLAGSMLQARLVDELVIYVAAKLMGNDARSLLQMPELQAMSKVQTMEFTDIRMIGRDIRITAKPKK